jgi:hypothetical protein
MINRAEYGTYAYYKNYYKQVLKFEGRDCVSVVYHGHVKHITNTILRNMRSGSDINGCVYQLRVVNGAYYDVMFRCEYNKGWTVVLFSNNK